MPIDAVADELAIRRVVATYSDAINRHDASAAAGTYAPDGTWTMQRPTMRGRAAIEEFLVRTFAKFSLTTQMTHSGMVEVDGDRAGARWQLTELLLPHDGPPLFIIGRYEDELVRLDEGWRSPTASTRHGT